jgi:hypothetical protein
MPDVDWIDVGGMHWNRPRSHGWSEAPSFEKVNIRLINHSSRPHGFA